MNPNFQQSWSPSAVFSPSAARQQALEAKDWAYIDQWLTAQYHPQTPPPFERNSDTLKALLALSTFNETANEELSLRRQVEAKALGELKARHDAIESSPPTALTLLADSLPPDGLLALHSLSLLTVALSIPATSTTTLATTLATTLTALTTTETHLHQQLLQLTTLQHRLTLQHHCSRTALSALTTLPLPSPSIATKTLQNTQTIHHLTQKSHEYTSRIGTLSRAIPHQERLSTISIKALSDEEKRIEELKEGVVRLESEVKAYQGLPPDRDLARLEVERVEGEWREAEARKEREYEKVVRR
ncbi:hypothetical protein L211DRAFT_840639 [Terfezia boudieri ATCC MYA-4762]|uniref:Uncharacterized protein n=1 Tax=Terfezia boudieri ATCC MYA-4762 TaxID=1051890 RepID=A0A3N4LJ04_9PEZI|nr:hypothetical protein L211DRAFT_840639 [Terfezia boudieri ATCC MYA-4762]